MVVIPGVPEYRRTTHDRQVNTSGQTTRQHDTLVAEAAVRTEGGLKTLSPKSVSFWPKRLQQTRP